MAPERGWAYGGGMRATVLVLLSVLVVGCAEPSPEGAWLEADTTRYEREPLRVNGGAYYQVDRHTLSFGRDGAFHDAYQLDVLSWQYDGTWTDGGETVTTTVQGSDVTTPYELRGADLYLDGVRYLPLNECGSDCY